MRVVLVVLVGILAGCADFTSVDCGFGLCPQGSACDAVHSLCVEPAQLKDCVGMADGTGCKVGSKDGTCTDGVCLPPVCGDHIVSGGEECDADKFLDNAQGCLDVGFYDDGPISCRSDCTIDTHACARTCGDGVLDREEVCDYRLDSTSSTCAALGFYEGTAAPCSFSCTFDTSGCAMRCGDGVVNGPEVCEPTLGLPSYLSCVDYGLDAGVATCSSGCNEDLARCHHYGLSTIAASPFFARGVWAADATTTFVVGTLAGQVNGAILRYDGPVATAITVPPGHPFEAVSGASTTTVFIVGGLGRIAKYDQGSVVDMASGVTGSLHGVFAVSATNVYAVGELGTILHFDGTSWSPMSSTITTPLYGVWATSTEAWAVGLSGKILHLSNATWTAQTSNTAQNLLAIWGFSTSDIYAVGTTGTILHYNGATWTPMTVATGIDLLGVWGASSDDVLAIGQSGLVHYDGVHWELIEENLVVAQGISGIDHTHVRAVEYEGALLRWDGIGRTRPIAQGGAGAAIWGTTSSNVYAAIQSPGGSGGPGTHHYDGATWSHVDATGSVAIWGSSKDDVFVSTNSGIDHWSGSSWSPQTYPTDPPVALGGSGPLDVYGVGDGGEVVHYDGQWTQVHLIDSSLTGVWASSSSDVWVVGAGVMSHYNGSSWTDIESGTTNLYTAIWGSAANDIYVVGFYGLVRHYDGSTWKTISVPSSRNLFAVSGTSKDDVFIGGVETLMHFDGTAWGRMTPGEDLGGNGDSIRGLWAYAKGVAVLGNEGGVHFIVRGSSTAL